MFYFTRIDCRLVWKRWETRYVFVNSMDASKFWAHTLLQATRPLGGACVWLKMGEPLCMAIFISEFIVILGAGHRKSLAHGTSLLILFPCSSAIPPKSWFVSGFTHIWSYLEQFMGCLLSTNYWGDEVPGTNTGRFCFPANGSAKEMPPLWHWPGILERWQK
jgi:hypothetical protein